MVLFTLLHAVIAEDSTILLGATTDTSEDTASESSSKAIDGAFNSGYKSDTTDKNAGVKEWRVQLSSSKKIVSFFFQYRPDNKNSLG